MCTEPQVNKTIIWVWYWPPMALFLLPIDFEQCGSLAQLLVSLIKWCWCPICTEEQPTWKCGIIPQQLILNVWIKKKQQPVNLRPFYICEVQFGPHKDNDSQLAGWFTGQDGACCLVFGFFHAHSKWQERFLVFVTISDTHRHFFPPKTA